MPAEWVLDASVVGAVLFNEDHSAVARRFFQTALDADAQFHAPDLMALEVASMAAKKVWRGELTEADGVAAVGSALRLVEEATPVTQLTVRAHVLAARHRFSAYDAAYLALAEMLGSRVATLDIKLVNRAGQEGLSGLVHQIA